MPDDNENPTPEPPTESVADNIAAGILEALGDPQDPSEPVGDDPTGEPDTPGLGAEGGAPTTPPSEGFDVAAAVRSHFGADVTDDELREVLPAWFNITRQLAALPRDTQARIARIVRGEDEQAAPADPAKPEPPPWLDPDDPVGNAVYSLTQQVETLTAQLAERDKRDQEQGQMSVQQRIREGASAGYTAFTLSTQGLDAADYETLRTEVLKGYPQGQGIFAGYLTNLRDPQKAMTAALEAAAWTNQSLRQKMLDASAGADAEQRKAAEAKARRAAALAGGGTTPMNTQKPAKTYGRPTDMIEDLVPMIRGFNGQN